MPFAEKYAELLAAGMCVRGCGREATAGSTRCSECWMGDIARDERRREEVFQRTGVRGRFALWQIRDMEEARRLARATHEEFAGATA